MSSNAIEQRIVIKNAVIRSTDNKIPRSRNDRGSELGSGGGGGGQSNRIRDSNHMANLWKHYLYELQLRAPTPKRVVSLREIKHRPAHYGREYHGMISREETDRLLEGEDGRYLVRESIRSPGKFTLSLKFGGQTKNFHLYYDGKQHYVGEKRFDTIHDLVADGLITLYLDAHAADYIASLASSIKYEESPYMTLHKRLKEKRKARRAARNKPEITRVTDINEPVEEEEEEEQVDVQTFEKAHQFKMHNFVGLPWCDFCGNFMWGLMGQGVKCEDCGFSAHKKCSEKVPNDCCPDLRHIKRIFGVDLTTLVKACNSTRPFVVDLCVTEIERRGLNTEGLYRVSGFADDLEALKAKFETEWEHVNKELRKCDDIHLVTGLLKMYFRLLPVPLITFDVYPLFMSAMKRASLDERLSGLKDAAFQLPPAHYQTLKYFMDHLSRVAAHQDKNLMSVQNLSTVFCPTLMRTPNIGLMHFQASSWQNECSLLETLISNHKKIFTK